MASVTISATEEEVWGWKEAAVRARKAFSEWARERLSEVEAQGTGKSAGVLKQGIIKQEKPREKEIEKMAKQEPPGVDVKLESSETPEVPELGKTAIEKKAERDLAELVKKKEVGKEQAFWIYGREAQEQELARIQKAGKALEGRR